MRRIIPACMLVFLLVTTAGCGIPISHSDPFYSAWEDWGAARFPLIKPYEVIFFEEVGGWTIDLDLSLYQPSNEMNSYLSIKEVEKISVIDSAILIYSMYERKDLDPQDVFLYYFVIIPGDAEDRKDDIVRGFHAEHDFLDFVKRYEIESVVWESPEDLNHKFITTGCLDWIPGCD